VRIASHAIPVRWVLMLASDKFAWGHFEHASSRGKPRLIFFLDLFSVNVD